MGSVGIWGSHDSCRGRFRREDVSNTVHLDRNDAALFRNSSMGVAVELTLKVLNSLTSLIVSWKIGTQVLGSFNQPRAARLPARCLSLFVHVKP